MANTRVDTVVIGSGPGGYVAGIRLGQLGVKTVVVEKDRPGGVCLNVGCIPSKALIHAAKTYEKMSHADTLGIAFASAPTVDMAKMQAWKSGIVGKLTRGVQQLLKANGAQLVSGSARLVPASAGSGHSVEVESDGKVSTWTAANVVIATGSRPVEIPGFAIDNERICDSSGALAWDRVPEQLVVIGGGYIGLELGTVYAKLGAKVTVLEALDSILSGMDAECVAVVARKLRKLGVTVHTSARATGWSEAKGRAVVSAETKAGESLSIPADRVLLSVGRRPNTEGIGLDRVGVPCDARGFIQVDAQLRTPVKGIFAIGDVAGGMLLAHKASKEAEVVAEVIAGRDEVMDVKAMPAVVFTDPEVASVGLTTEEAGESHEVITGKFPFAALGRAMSVGETEGFAKVVADAKTHEILGIHVVGNGASDIIAEAALAIEMGAVCQDVALTVHAHPTLAESIREAAAAAIGEAVHVVNR